MWEYAKQSRDGFHKELSWSVSQDKIPHWRQPKISIQIDCIARTLKVWKGFIQFTRRLFQLSLAQKTDPLHCSCSYVQNHSNYFDLIRHLMLRPNSIHPHTSCDCGISGSADIKRATLTSLRTLMRWNLTSDKLKNIKWQDALSVEVEQVVSSEDEQTVDYRIVGDLRNGDHRSNLPVLSRLDQRQAIRGRRRAVVETNDTYRADSQRFEQPWKVSMCAAAVETRHDIIIYYPAVFTPSDWSSTSLRTRATCGWRCWVTM